MNSKRDFERAVDQWLDKGSDATPPEVIDAVLLAVRNTPQERRAWWSAWRTNHMTTYAKSIAAAAVVLAVVIVGYQFLPGRADPGATPAPAPSLIARGSFVEHDWGQIEFEAIREGSSVTGHMTLPERDDGFGPIAVDLRCTLATDDGLVMIGGYITVGEGPFSPGTLAWIALQPGSPDLASVNYGSRTDLPATQTTDCRAYLDAWLQFFRTGGFTIPLRVLDGGVEFGP